MKQKSPFFILILALVANFSSAKPLVVHEWGVQIFDWAKLPAREVVPDFPSFVYTEKRPGKTLNQPGARARDETLKLDHPGISVRYKPLLYFYPPPNDTAVDVEMGFQYGSPIAWWPQVNILRNRNSTGSGEAFLKWRETVEKLPDGLFFRKGVIPARPEDDRMQLVWNRLQLTENLPEGMALEEDERDSEWLKIARQVDAAFVSNGEEVEKFLFYEATTNETPAASITPMGNPWPKPDEPIEYQIQNHSKFPIFDVFAVYRDRKKNILWTDYISVLPVSKARQSVALRIPNFEHPGKTDSIHLDEEEFSRKTTDRLIECLTAGNVNKDSSFEFLNSNRATVHHALFPKEAEGMEAIWHDDMFEADGLTIVYRESPAYLDHAMPLNIFCPNGVVLSRCGLVINHNIKLPPKLDIKFGTKF